MRVHYCDHHEVPLPEKHRFPMHKYATLRTELVRRGILPAESLVPVEPADWRELTRVHDAGYVEAFVQGQLTAQQQRRIGFPWSEALVRRTFASVAGTLSAARAALEDGFSGSLAGGTHHAHRDFGSGYCVINDLAVAAYWLLEEAGLHRVAIVDLDVHQGDGTASICSGDPRVLTISVHGQSNFPFRKSESDLDFGLVDDTEDDAYLALLDESVMPAVERFSPAFILYQAGVDALDEDRLGRLALSHAGLEQRDERVFGLAQRLGVPALAVLGGGYSQPIDASIEAHVGTYRAAMRIFDSATRGIR